MADRVIPACRQWLGLDPTDLASPHLVLGIPDGERNPLIIVRAADRRLAALRGVPERHGAERDALAAQVEVARDRMLAASVAPQPAGSASPTPPPVPPLTPPVAQVVAADREAFVLQPPVPPAREEETGPDMSFASPRRQAIRRQDSAEQATAVAVSTLVLAAAAATLYIAWPHLQRSLKLARRPERSQATAVQVDPASDPASATHSQSVARQTEPRPRPRRPDPSPDPESRPPLPMEQDSAPTVRADRRPASEPSPTAAQPGVDVDRVRERVGAAIRRAYAALQRGDFTAANRELESVADTALDDQRAADRLRAWRQLAAYAAEYPTYRARALESAASTAATYTLGDRHIGVVEFNERLFIYRDSKTPGRNVRVPHDAIPADIEALLVKSWFAKDGRTANLLYLGAAAFCRPKPDLAAARRDWERAAARGEDDGSVLLQVLDDPVVRGD
jgi:hypothetical protein